MKEHEIWEVIADTPTISLVTLTNNGSEYSYVIPDETTRIFIQPRGLNPVKLSFKSGGTLVNDGYITIAAGSTYYEDMLVTEGLTVYLNSTNDNVEVEVITWQ